MNPERRKTHRVRIYLPLRVRFNQNQQVSETLTRDLSGGGLRYISQQPVPVLAEFGLELTLAAGREPFTARGKVVWFQRIPHSEQFEVGVSFLEVSQENQRRLSTYLYQLSNQSEAVPA